MAASSEMLCAMAALVLKDGQKEVTGDNISKILQSVGAEVEAYWPKLFASALEGVDIESLMTAVGSAPAAGAAGPAGAAPAAAAPAEEPKKEEKEEESDEEMGFSLFD